MNYETWNQVIVTVNGKVRTDSRYNCNLQILILIGYRCHMEWKRFRDSKCLT